MIDIISLKKQEESPGLNKLISEMYLIQLHRFIVEIIKLINVYINNILILPWYHRTSVSFEAKMNGFKHIS